MPPFRRRLAEVPFGFDQPYWIEDPDFDIEFHVRELALPAPGDDKQLAEQAARLHARPLDRRRPLWELYLISGLSGGRIAIYTKVHHAAIDGVSGNDILAAVLDLSPEGRELGEVPRVARRPGPRLHPAARPQPRVRWPASRCARCGSARRSLASLPGLAPHGDRPPELPVVDRFLPAPRQQRGPAADAACAPRAPRSTGRCRRTAAGRSAPLPLEDVKAVKHAAGGTVNDVVMALCAGALRRWLLDHDALPDAPLIAAVPVSVRTEAQKGTGGNRVSTMIAPLPTHLDRPARAAARTATRRCAPPRTSTARCPPTLLSDVTQFAMPALAGQAARVAARLRLVEWLSPFNLIISNVPGPERSRSTTPARGCSPTTRCRPSPTGRA